MGQNGLGIEFELLITVRRGSLMYTEYFSPIPEGFLSPHEFDESPSLGRAAEKTASRENWILKKKFFFLLTEESSLTGQVR